MSNCQELKTCNPDVVSFPNTCGPSVTGTGKDFSRLMVAGGGSEKREKNVY